jgi:hypothetical protein
LMVCLSCKIDILQDRHLLNSELGAIAGFFLHRSAASVKFCMFDVEVRAAPRLMCNI